MSFNVGGSAEQTKTKSKTETSSTTTPIVPGWASDLTQRTAGRVNGLLDLDPNSLVAPANALQQQAAAGAENLNGSPWNYDAALDLSRGAANTAWVDPYMSTATPFSSGGKAYDYVGNYLNPYLKDVVDSTSADLAANAGQVRAQQALDLAGSGAFGGSGAALTQSMTEGELARARASSLSGLRSHAYDTALTAASGDADRATQARISNATTALQDRAQKVGFGFQAQQQQLAAASQLASVAGERDATQRNNIATQAQLGDTFRDIDQQQRQAPVTSTQQIVAALSGLPISLFTGEQKVGTEKTTGTQTKIAAHGEVGNSKSS